MCQTWKIIIRQIVKLLMLNKIVMHARWRKRRKENFLKHLQSYQLEPWNRVKERIYLMLTEEMDDHLMKKIGEIVIKTLEQEQITGAYVKIVRLKFLKLIIYATKTLQLWMTINSKVSPCKLFNWSLKEFSWIGVP